MKQSKPSWRGTNTNNSTCPPKPADRYLRNKSLMRLRSLPKLKVGDLVLHRQRGKYFYNPQTLGIIVEKATIESNYPCWYVWGPDWQANTGFKFLAVLEHQLERIN